tara:strand:- start:452 stop:652 length:201 start_codon:yes stop_codon:yes gene_type:complete
MQTVEKTINKLVDQLRETVLLIKMLHERVQEIESRIVVLENNKNVMTAISNLIPTKEVVDVDTKRD